MFGEVGVVTAVKGELLLQEDYGVAMEWVFGLRAIWWQEVESIFDIFFS